MLGDKTNYALVMLGDNRIYTLVMLGDKTNYKLVMLGDNIIYTLVVGLEFNSPVNCIKVMLSRSVYLTTLFLGRVSPIRG